MGWGNKAIEIRSVDTGHLDGVFMHKKAQKLKFLCERNDKASLFCMSIVKLLSLRRSYMILSYGRSIIIEFFSSVTDPLSFGITVKIAGSCCRQNM